MFKKTIAELAQGLKNKEFSSTELTKMYLNRIKEFNPKLNAFITITEEQALSDAKHADEQLKLGTAGIMTGIPIAQKDLFCTKNIKTTCGSKILHNFISPYDATVVAKFKAAGTVHLGKTNMDEFAMGSSNETSYFGPVLNPWNTETIPGGSSGGSSCAIAAMLTPCATGTDTGGSIRQPAALTNLTGLKPTYGRVSRYGMIAFASSLDQAGPLARTAEDAAIMLNIMAGFDNKDSTSVNVAVPDYTQTLNDSIKGLRIGIVKEHFAAGLNPQVRTAIETAITEFKKLGVTFKEISMPHAHLAAPVYYIVAPAECSSNLSRFDGVRFGYRCDNPKNLTDLYMRSRGEGFGAEVKRRIMIGAYTLSAGFYDAYYLKAQQIRTLISNDFTEAFNDVDFILSPTSPTPAFKLNEKTKDPLSMYLSDIYTISANLAGLPGISIPCGFVDNLPIGLQLVGRQFSEAKLLNASHQYQLITDWHTKIPTNF